EITLTDILTAREERVAIQNALLGEYKVPVISFTMNIAGPVKVTGLSHRAFLWGMEQLRLGFLQNRMSVKKEFSRSLPTGDEGYFAIDAPAERVKALCVEIEEAKRIGRFFDMDVIGTDGRKLERGSERDCIVCHKPGRDCASRRLHTVAELRAATAVQLSWGLREDDRRRIGALATRALLEEVAVTPKPGLVDRANNGAHRDMDFSSFQASAAALAPYWEECFRHGWQDAHVEEQGRACPRLPAETFAALRPLGKQAERDMLAATGGVNTHKGAIFTLGVLCGAIGRLWSAEAGFPDAEAILNEAAAMTRQTLEAELPAARWNTAGEALYRKYGARGIRGQVADGLPAVREISLPVFQQLLADGLDRNHAAAVTLLHLIANVEDTNLLHRGGPEGAAWAKDAAGALLAACRDEPCSSGIRNECNLPQANPDDRPPAQDRPTGDCLLRKPDKQGLSLHSIPSLEQIAELDRQFIQRNLSPGGCADLLAVTLFLESLCS
ncbi:MAG: citrate lyase holo-[Oscillospiraceae bacterium]|nr:citrate lyase holo-[acyl-carrier protein] synthase [Oscillospiraceae bacterium]